MLLLFALLVDLYILIPPPFLDLLGGLGDFFFDFGKSFGIKLLDVLLKLPDFACSGDPEPIAG